MSVNKVLFLDIDGVLNNEDSCILYESPFKLNPISMGYLKKIVDEFNFKIVISSVWRGKGFSALSLLLQQYGINDSCFFKYDEYIKDKTQDSYVAYRTPFIKVSSDRSEEISTFVKEHRIDTFIILDDENFKFKSCDICKNNFIKVENGLGIKEYHRLVDKLLLTKQL